MLLSMDWDAYSGTRELVFDAPIWGTRDLEHDRLEAWRERVQKRGGGDWAALAEDFPLYPGWEALAQYAGTPAFVALSHADAWGWLERFPGRDVLNIDSHHDLASFSGDVARVRPGNWAGLGLRAGLIGKYTCLYPEWHAELPVAEGFDLDRTHTELLSLLPPEVLDRVTLTCVLPLPPPAQVEALLLVQSPAWTNPAHDAEFLALTQRLNCETLTQPIGRSRFDR
ncbi:arginase [Deinococcus arenicola]|uniref:Arginase n=1 Tax=Deinococcus arenicola TaxID=2994950 RepID=A0ABU4DQG3_9DEIO|nr:arginase [Deinococcus sp. ZS9-10]MDV6374673.1 arginase [Deinococcus sp. ZS9-10]